MNLFGGGSQGFAGPADSPYAWLSALVTVLVIVAVVLLLSRRRRRR
jgi:hypothetical protein